MRYVLSVVAVLFVLQISAQAPPSPTPNIENIPMGSYIIPLDLEKQSIIRPDLGDEVVNTSAYGLVFRLMEEGFPLKWAIKSGKQKDEIDFTARVSRLYPSTSGISIEDFRSGAFILTINDFEEVSCVSGFFSQEGFIQNIITEFGNDVNVYQLEENTAIDIRYTLDFAPKIAVLNDGGFEEEHIRVLNRANIPFEAITSEVFIENYSCYTFISQPHLEELENDSYIASIKDFLDIGGNFYAQCISVATFENQANLMSLAGITATRNDNLSYTYSGYDYPLLQVTGELPGSLVGTMGNFSSVNGYKPSSYSLIKNQDGLDILRVADTNDVNDGGNIFYMAGHGSGTFTDQNLTIPIVLMDQLFLNALFMPAGITYACAGEDQCICDGGSITIGCEKTSSVLNYSWSPSEGLSCTDCPNPIASPRETTTYTLTVSNGAQGDCTSDEMTVLVFDDKQFEEVDVFICPTETYTYEGEILSIGDTREYTIKTAQGCDSILTLNILPKSPPRTPIPFVACDGQPVIFMGETVFNGETKEFVLQDDKGCDSILVVSVSEDYFTEVTVETCPEVPYVFDNMQLTIGTTTTFDYRASDGCDSIVSVSVNPLNLSVQFSTDNVTCRSFGDGSLTVSNPSGGTPPYSFTIDNGAYQQDSTFADISAGNHELYLRDATGCIEIFPFEITQPAAWNVEIIAEEDTITSGDAIIITATHQNPRDVRYKWTPESDLSCSDCQNPVASPKRTTSYTVEVTDEEGCKQVDRITIIVVEPRSFIANVFTPNGDGINDTLFPQFRGDVVSFDFKVFNRWGALVFAENQNPENGWDGIYRGDLAPEDIYIYSIIVNYADGTSETISGDTALIR